MIYLSYCFFSAMIAHLSPLLVFAAHFVLIVLNCSNFLSVTPPLCTVIKLGYSVARGNREAVNTTK